MTTEQADMLIQLGRFILYALECVLFALSLFVGYLFGKGKL